MGKQYVKCSVDGYEDITKGKLYPVHYVKFYELSSPDYYFYDDDGYENHADVTWKGWELVEEPAKKRSSQRLTEYEQRYILEHPNESSRSLAKKLWGTPKRKSSINDFRKRVKESDEELKGMLEEAGVPQGDDEDFGEVSVKVKGCEGDEAEFLLSSEKNKQRLLESVEKVKGHRQAKALQNLVGSATGDRSSVDSTMAKLKSKYVKEKSEGETSGDALDMTDEEKIELLSKSPEYDVANLAKRLRTAQRTNSQLRKINNQTMEPTFHLDEVVEGIRKATSQLSRQSLRAPVQSLDKTTGKRATVEVLFSDFQLGKVGEHYNSELAEKAIRRYGETVVDKILKHQSEYKYEKILLAMLGDTVEDHLKHGVQSATSTDSGLAEQIAEATRMIWQYVISPLASLDIEMEVVCIAGNHGSSQHKGMDMYKAGLFSYDYPIYKAQEALCEAAGYDHVKFVIPEGVFGYTEIYGNWVVYEHGYFNTATEKSMDEQMKKRGNQLRKHVSYFRCGDMHHTCTYDSHRLVLNGAFFGTDSGGVEYSGILGFSSTPSQVMMIHCPEKSLGRNTVKEAFNIQVADGY